jgi:hypothetical protein
LKYLTTVIYILYQGCPKILNTPYPKRKEHTRHLSVAGFILNIMSAIAAYSFFPKKPSIKKDIAETNHNLIARFN